jgi:O-acetyl-ADP-ribose deacetylase (regulator of RNase III)
MIEFTKGDMFEKSVDVRINTVNCKGVMGAGVALAFKTRYPEMFKDYKKACSEGIVQPGVMHVWKNLLGDWIINFPTKRDWREQSRYEDILSGLDALRRYLKDFGPISVALPALGCGHGGLDWNQVSQMIKEKLSDLDAHIFVFEPADSRNAGRIVLDEPSNENIRDLKDLGFKSINLPLQFRGEGLPLAGLIKGDEALLAQHWIALLPSKDPTERELNALDSVARQMSLEDKQIVVAMVHATRATEQITEIFLKYRIAVVLVLPFGPLTRKSVSRTSTENRHSSLALLSIAAPNEAWGRPVLAKSMTLLRTGASSVLLSDPAPEWLKSNIMHTWAKQPLFYLRYETQSDELRRMLDQEGAHSISRRLDTGEPNLSPLISRDYSIVSGEAVKVLDVEEQFTISLALETASQLRDLANAIERSPSADGKVRITVSYGTGTEDLKMAFRRILKDYRKNK